MAKEMMIVFVYDTESCQNESDDPVDAVLYFHPSWVSDVQRISLVGQLMGTTHFLTDSFGARPHVISLQSGKFVLKEFGRFILAVGTDRNVPSSTLVHRAELLSSLLRFFHRDIQTIFNQFNGNNDQLPSASGQKVHKCMSEKLYHIFETYLPILQHSGNIFQNMPISHLPKSASNIFLDAMQTLQSCQQSKGVLGGAMLFHNKVLATQLSPELTKNLVLTDPYRIKSTAESIIVKFHIPLGVQLHTVYMSAKELRRLSAEALQAQNICNHHHSTMNNNQPTIVPFQYKKKIKRDKSIIFTNIPEEVAVDLSTSKMEIAAVPKARPNHLPLRFKNITSKDLPESGFSSINFDESDSFPQFIGKTSVCSTPMTEMKVLHGAVLSICANIDETDSAPAKPFVKSPEAKVIADNKPFRMEARRHSLSNIQDSLRKIRLTMRPFGHGLSKLGKSFRERSPSPTHSFSTEEDDDGVDFDDPEKNTYRTITDPMYPVFNSAGAPISKCLFQQFLDEHELGNKKGDSDNQLDNGQNNTASDSIAPSGDEADSVIFDGFDSEMKTSPIHRNLNAITPSRMSLSLPLKSLNLNPDPATSDVPLSGNMFETPQNRRKLSGIQLTPLMTKLSILAMNDERSSGFSSWDTTPGCTLDLATPGGEGAKMFRRRSSTSKYEDLAEVTEDPTEKEPEEVDQMRRCELFVCGQQNMTMLLIFEQAASQNQELVQTMFDTCVSRLARIEASLSQTLNVNVDGDKTEGGYSFLSIDPHWDTLQRGGPWESSELNTLEYMRNDFQCSSGKTDLILRTDESVLYGYRHGQSGIFYKQVANAKQGIPPPADAIGTIATNAKRRLERDHSIILL